MNEVVARWFNTNDERKIVLVDPQPIRSFGHSFRSYLPGANQRYPGPEKLDRFEHVEGSAREGLPAAIAATTRRPIVESPGVLTDR